VSRRISSDNTSQWRIRVTNEKWRVTSSADVLPLIQALHIQLDNLCMFLPQLLRVFDIKTTTAIKCD
jgi:hypothetical protein